MRKLKFACYIVMLIVSSACSATDESASAQAFWLQFRGEDVVQKTMSSVIAEQRTSGYDASVEEKGFRVHQFEFHQVSGKWLLTDAYLEE